MKFIKNFYRNLDFRDFKEFIIDSGVYIALTVLVLFIVIYVVALQQVVGPSMEPNYKNQDILILNKLQYRLFKPKRFQVVAAEDPSGLVIKRIIGLPGEEVDFRNGILYINNQQVEENFEKQGNTEDFDLSILEKSIIPEGYYLLVGDNRENSTDSRDKRVGLIHKNEFIGKVMFRIWRVN